jgi:hypothetical protein
MQLFLHGFSGATAVLHVADCATAQQLKHAIQVCAPGARAWRPSLGSCAAPAAALRGVHTATLDPQDLSGVPSRAQLLVCGSRQLRDELPLSCQGVAADSTVHVTARLLGGKGGFGALLRGQGRDGKITTNFDACRDLSGRRIRHQTAEEKLQKWQEGAKEREAEQLALRDVKEQAKKERKEQQSQVCAPGRASGPPGTGSGPDAPRRSGLASLRRPARLCLHIGASCLCGGAPCRPPSPQLRAPGPPATGAGCC